MPPSASLRGRDVPGRKGPRRSRGSTRPDPARTGQCPSRVLEATSPRLLSRQRRAGSRPNLRGGEDTRGLSGDARRRRRTQCGVSPRPLTHPRPHPHPATPPRARGWAGLDWAGLAGAGAPGSRAGPTLAIGVTFPRARGSNSGTGSGASPAPQRQLPAAASRAPQPPGKGAGVPRSPLTAHRGPARPARPARDARSWPRGPGRLIAWSPASRGGAGGRARGEVRAGMGGTDRSGRGLPIGADRWAGSCAGLAAADSPLARGCPGNEWTDSGRFPGPERIRARGVPTREDPGVVARR